MPVETAKSPPAFVVSGGISLGAYQAGFIATLVRFWSVARRESQNGELGDPTPRVWTGASAGAVNALLGGLASCDQAFAQPQWSPEESLFWQLWIKELDLDKLLPEEDSHRDNHLFSTGHMSQAMDLIRETALNKEKTRFRENCSFAFGSTVTNLSGRDIPFGSGGPDSQSLLKRVTEKLVVQVFTTDQGALKARLPYRKHARHAPLPHIEVQDEEFRYYPALGSELPQGEGGQDVLIETVLRTPQASGAFPVAFAPVELPVHFFNGADWQLDGTLKLVDGGFLNNNPIDLADRLGRRWRDSPEQITRMANFEPLRFPIIYLDQDVVDWSWKEDTRLPQESDSPLSKLYLQNASNLLSAAQDSVILDTLENDPSLSERIKIPRRSAVLPSEFRFAMVGFFDQRFREHDFYRGMLDAIRFMSAQFASTQAVEFLVPPVPGESAEDRGQRIRQVLGISSPGFNCVADGACGAADLAELGKLREATNDLTILAKKDQLETDDIDAFLRALHERGYTYSSGIMNGAKATGKRNDLMPVRLRVGKAFRDMAKNQRGGLKIALRPTGAAFLDDWFTYAHPRRSITVSAMRQRGIGIGYETPVFSYEGGRERGAYNRSELRLGAVVSSLGLRDIDQTVPGKTRLRWASFGLYADWVSDMDGLYGTVSALELGPYFRWRAGLGVSGSYLAAPSEGAFQLPEARLGLDVAEMVGLRLVVPIYALRMRKGEFTDKKVLPNIFKESGVGVEVLLTWW